MVQLYTVVGARPQFVKAAVISRIIRTKFLDTIHERFIHTGQHYDANMSEVFFEEMDIPHPALNLAVGSGSHATTTAKMMVAIEQDLLEAKPDVVLVYGDTNSTLAAALSASKLHIPIAHVEAGLRSFNRRMPEEINRVMCDHLSTWCFCPTNAANENLDLEGLHKRSYLVGDVMLDACEYYRSRNNIDVQSKQPDYYVLTIHRAENTDNVERLSSIVRAINEAKNMRAIFPVHPRTKKALAINNLRFGSHIEVIEPVGYLEMLSLLEGSTHVVTDSGGLQKEAFFLERPCITLRDETEWTETVVSGWNTLVGSESRKILHALNTVSKPALYPTLYGDGRTGEKIIDVLLGKAK